MGLNSHLIGIGSFYEGVVEHLDYDADYYKEVDDGTLVITHILHCVTSEQSRDLAKFTGCVHPFGFNYHNVNPSEVDHKELKKIFSDMEIDSLGFLMCEGFKFMFVPNG